MMLVFPLRRRVRGCFLEVGEWCRFNDLKGMGHRRIDTRRISDKTEEERLRDRLVESVSLKDIFDKLGISQPDWRALRPSSWC